jgi:hypothetical protein
MIRLAAVAASAVLLAGCYSLIPTGGAVPSAGTEIAFDVNDVGRVALGGSMGPEIAQIEGRLVSKDSTEYLVAVSVVRLLRGGEQTWHGENVRIKPEHVSSVYERRFSRGRSLALGAIGIGAAALIGTQAITGGGTVEPQKIPGDTGVAQRGRRP